MDDNGKCNITSTIERSSIGTVINGDVDMQCPVFTVMAPLSNSATPPEENLEELKEDRAIWKVLLRRARLWAALRPLATAVITLLVLGELGYYRPTSAAGWPMLGLVTCAIPMLVWFAWPAPLKERHRWAKRTVKTSTAALDHLEARIAYLEVRQHRRERRRRE